MSSPWTENANSYVFSSSTSEIEEEEEEGELYEREPLASIKEEEEISSLFSSEVNSLGARDEDSVYVAVGKSHSSMDALSWTLSHFVNRASTTVYLVHVFPQIQNIPSPLGMLPKSQVSATQVESYMEQERGKRRQLLQKYFDVCSVSKVMVDTVLVESDMVAKAVLDLIPILNITKLVVGTTNSNFISRKLKSRRGVGISHQIFESAPITCEVKVVCGGQDVTSHMPGSPSPSTSDSHSAPPANEDYFKVLQEADDDDGRNDDSFACMCFRTKF